MRLSRSAARSAAGQARCVIGSSDRASGAAGGAGPEQRLSDTGAAAKKAGNLSISVIILLLN